MTALILRWRKPDPTVVTRWAGPSCPVFAAAAAVPPQPIAAVIGPPGPQGPPGEVSPPVVFTQSSASAEWIINHNLGFWPFVTIHGVGGNEVDAEVANVSLNQVRVLFSQPTAGSAIVR